MGQDREDDLLLSSRFLRHNLSQLVRLAPSAGGPCRDPARRGEEREARAGQAQGSSLKEWLFTASWQQAFSLCFLVVPNMRKESKQYA